MMTPHDCFLTFSPFFLWLALYALGCVWDGVLGNTSGRAGI